MFCWQARRRFADLIAGATAARVDRHLESCAACRTDLSRLRDVAGLVADAAGVARAVAAAEGSGDAFEERVLRAARARLSGEDGAGAAPLWRPPWLPSLLRPVPLGAALSVMVASVVLSHFVARAPLVSGPDAPAATVSSGLAAAAGAAGDLDDSVAPPREVRFVVEEDLVGARRGRIPLTTYVLEPPPEAHRVMRASL